MPIINMSASELKSLIDKPVTDDQLKTVLPLIKCEIDAWEGDELSVEVTPDRPDLLGVEGIARQISYWLGFRRGLHRFRVSKPVISIFADTVKSRPEIVAGCSRGLNLNNSSIKSLMQLQEAIDLTIGRDRIKTAIGIHDASKVTPPFYYREVGADDVSFVPLGFSREMTIREILKEHPKGIQYRHVFSGKNRYPLIVDSKERVISFPPIINGELTKVTVNTRDIFIDITGFDQTPLNYALNIMLSALESRGGMTEGVKINNRLYPHMEPRPVKIDRDTIKSMLGVGLKDSEISDCLERMGYDTDMKTGTVLVPPYRADILHPVDVVEDVAIAYGFNDFVPEVPRLPTIGRPDPEELFALKLKHIMVGLGFQEMVNLSLSSEEKQFSMMGARKPGVVELENPVSGEFTIFRHWIIPSLMENLAVNIHRRYPQRIFELAECVHPDRLRDTGTRNVKRLGALISHGSAGFSEAMSLFKAFAEPLPFDIKISEENHPSFISGRCAAISSGGKKLGLVGEIHPAAITSFGLKMPVAGFEIDVSHLWYLVRKKR